MFLHLFFAVSNIFEVKLNASEPVQALKGQRLVLNCTATAELNSRANISWEYPNQVIRPTEGKDFLHPYQLFRGLLTRSKVACFLDLQLFSVKPSPRWTVMCVHAHSGCRQYFALGSVCSSDPDCF